MTKRALTATQVAALKKHGVHPVAPSLYLHIRSHGTRSWLFRYSRKGENQWLGLGSFTDKSLSEARDEAAELRVRVRRGGDPLAEREQAAAAAKPKKKVPTFADCADKYVEAHRAGWKNEKHLAQHAAHVCQPCPRQASAPAVAEDGSTGTCGKSDQRIWVSHAD